MHGVGRAETNARVRELLELVGLPGAERRAVAALSGGEQQRVALARALAPRPKLLMLDEPFGQLDRSLRERLVVELLHAFPGIGHDGAGRHARPGRGVRARRPGRRDAGRPDRAGGHPLDVWQRPASAFVARFLGFDNVTAATVTGQRRRHRLGPGPGARRLPQGEVDLLVRPAGVGSAPRTACAARSASAPSGKPRDRTAAARERTRAGGRMRPAGYPGRGRGRGRPLRRGGDGGAGRGRDAFRRLSSPPPPDPVRTPGSPLAPGPAAPSSRTAG